jgi:hypothetical protein
MPDPARRLSSWKEIAAYLRREVRTFMRWEKERGLPVHRGSNGKSGVVFADMDELDAWTRGELAAGDVPVAVADALPPGRAVPSSWRIRMSLVAAVLAILFGLAGWQTFTADDEHDTVVLTTAAVVARRADGSEKWRHDFRGERVGPMYGRSMNTVEPLGSDGVLAGFSEATRTHPPGIRSGQVLWFDRSGSIKRSFSFEDRLAFGSRVYGAPWSISDYQVSRGDPTRRIAVSAHHQTWWPSIVTVLDEQWQRQGSFVHAGWVEHMRWLSADRLAIAGFSNFMDGGMVALLDPSALSGQSPAPEDSVFNCTECGPDRPTRYVVLPRSEVNRVSGAPFNRASMTLQPGVLLIHTLELPATLAGTPANAIYEFTPGLELVDASYSDRYWEAHQELERLGKITHTRQRCPDREGPREVQVWEPETGWTKVTAARGRGRSSEQ